MQQEKAYTALREIQKNIADLEGVPEEKRIKLPGKTKTESVENLIRDLKEDEEIFLCFVSRCEEELAKFVLVSEYGSGRENEL